MLVCTSVSSVAKAAHPTAEGGALLAKMTSPYDTSENPGMVLSSISFQSNLSTAPSLCHDLVCSLWMLVSLPPEYLCVAGTVRCRIAHLRPPEKHEIEMVPRLHQRYKYIMDCADAGWRRMAKGAVDQSFGSLLFDWVWPNS